MPSFRNAFGWSYYPLKIVNQAYRFARPKARPRLRVLSYHDMAEADEELLARQLRWLLKRWNIVSPQDFAAIVDGKMRAERDTLLLTFDDGTISNLHVAEHVLRPLGIRALFFVVGKYAMLAEGDDWRAFAAKNIVPTRNRTAFPENFRNMSIRDLKMLLTNGHVIGAHTATHARLSTLTGESLREEIVGGADLLEAHMGTPIRHFAYPFGDFASISVEAIRVARQRFAYVYTAMRGDNMRAGLPWHLLRDSNDPHDSLWFTGACLEGAADFLYTRKHRSCVGAVDLTG